MILNESQTSIRKYQTAENNYLVNYNNFIYELQ